MVAPGFVSIAFLGVTALFSVAFSPLTGSALTSYLVGFLSSLSLIPSPSLSGFLGSVPLPASSLSEMPSLSSSVSVTSGVPSRSVSRWIVTGTSTSVEPLSPSETVTGILTSRSSSSLPQSSTFGVPVNLPFSSTFKPLTPFGAFDVTVASSLISIAFLLSGTGCPSVTSKSFTGLALTSYLVGFLSSLSLMPSLSLSDFLGFVPSSFSFSSVNPSLSSSVSVTSGVPSPSVSRWIVTGTSTSVEPLSASETVTGIFTSRSSSSSAQSLIFGVPERLPVLSTLRPFFSLEPNVTSLSASITLVGSTGLFSTTDTFLIFTSLTNGTATITVLSPVSIFTLIFLAF